MEQPKKTTRAPDKERDDRFRLQRVKKKKGSSGSKLSGVINTFSYILFILGVSLLVSAFGIVLANDMLALVKEERAVTLVVEEPVSTSDMARMLKEDAIIKYPWAFSLFAKLKKTDEFPAGKYEIDADMDYGQLIAELTSDTTELVTVAITFPEGFTLAQIAEELEKNGVCTQKDFFDVANNYDFAHFMLKDVPLEENRLEGYLFPDTYEFYKAREKALTAGETRNNAINAINKMLNNFVKKYTKSMRNLTEEKGLTIAEVVNIASLVEKEAQKSEERTTIAGVIFNRLNNSDSYPYLNIDATLLYTLGHKEKLTEEDLKTDSPYNTYTAKGLPPTAICNPGLACIMAAILPEEHRYYYYVLDPDTGSHIFSRTLEEHNRAVAQVND